jgi:hypothetical protein
MRRVDRVIIEIKIIKEKERELILMMKMMNRLIKE